MSIYNRNEKSAFFVIARLIVQTWLFGMFLHFFGRPAVERYLDRKVMVVTSRRETGGTQAPALTILVRGSDTQNGWKKDISTSKFFVDSLCSDIGTNQSIIGCIKGNTYDLSEISQSVNLGFPILGVVNIGNNPWIEDFTYSFMGRTYTLNINKKLRYDSLANSLLRIGLEPNHTYDIYIHDPKYFYATRNPESEAPSVWKAVNPEELPYCLITIHLPSLRWRNLTFPMIRATTIQITTSGHASRRASQDKQVAKLNGTNLAMTIFSLVLPSNSSGEKVARFYRVFFFHWASPQKF